jgi:hypothetical protein
VANNRNFIDLLHDNLNPYFKTRSNPNWKAIVEAIGEADNDVADLVKAVREQFFISTAERPYLDTHGTNVGVIRPRVVGMDDSSFRQYIPVLSYQPKQVKLIIDQLLDIFFFRESTTAFSQSAAESPYALEDSWELVYKVDGINEENIVFTADQFSNIAAATAEEIAAAVNRQAQYSFAIPFNDLVVKKEYVRIFSKTVGSKGSIEMRGGRANISMRFNGTISGAGSGTTTQWLISIVGDTVTFQHAGGTPPGLDHIQIGDLVIMELPGNSGTFEVVSVDLTNSRFSFVNLFGTPGSFDHGVNTGYVQFLRVEKAVVWTRDNRAVAWEVTPGEIIIEIPASPPVVRRNQVGSAHINGLASRISSIVSSTSLEVEEAGDWPSSGTFALAPKHQVINHIETPLEDSTSTSNIDGRYTTEVRYTYTSKSGNTLIGISPDLPVLAQVIEAPIFSISRNGSNLVTVTTTIPHGLNPDSDAYVYDVVGGTNLNGTWKVNSIISTTSFNYYSLGPAETLSGGKVRLEQIGLASSGGVAYLMSAVVNTGLFGPYLWDTGAPFVLSSYEALVNEYVEAGTTVLNLKVQTPNSVPVEQGFLIFDYGTERQEGPVRYLYKASDSIVALDPSYVFQFDHPVGSAVVAIRRKGAHVLGGLGRERSFYTTDPSAARIVLRDLVEQVKSAGIFLNYIVRYPQLYYYSSFDTYGATEDVLD